MEAEELKAILDNHLKWLRGEADAKRADLRDAQLQGADLQGADLQGADLQGADLRDAQLQGADLQRADLQRADLRDADLQDADLQGADLRGADLQETVLDGINWLSYLGIVPDSQGVARAYKVTKADGSGTTYTGLDYATNAEVTASLCTDVNQQCAAGVNLATLAWCLNEKQEGRRLFLMEFSCAPENICVPVASDGKFRVAKCRKVGECDWHGNLLGTRKGNEAEAAHE